MPASVARPPLRRPRDCVLGGVCAAVSRHLGWGVGVTRLVAVGLALSGGAGILLYAWLWALTPLEDAEPGTLGLLRRRVPVAWLLFALAVVGGLLLVGPYAVDGTAVDMVVPVLITVLCATGAVVWDQLVDATGPRTGTSPRILRLSCGGLLVAIGLFGQLTRGSQGTVAMTLLYVGVLLIGVIVLIAPWLLRLWRELIQERTKRVREEERAELAAHLHDSVLQTLALIQTRAGASSEVARIARAQERELREWLYSGERRVDGDLVADLRETGLALELDYAVRFDIVSVGETGELSSGEIAAAAREAMLNAARHAGGEVSVYVEGTAQAIDVYIRDRGPGFRLDDVPADRMGVRESILGRMRRAGGSASVGPGAGGEGAEVRLHLERPDRRQEGPGDGQASEQTAGQAGGGHAGGRTSGEAGAGQ